MADLNLSLRLRAVADMVPSCESLADIGCDHGYLPIYLVQQGRIGRAIASDIRSGPLAAAEENVRAFGMCQEITLRLTPGLSGFQAHEAETITICGMGGQMIRTILQEADPFVLQDIKTLIVQPQTEPGIVRHTLHELKYSIEDESFVQDRGKAYVILRAVHGEERYDSEYDYRYGRILFQKQDPGYGEWLLTRAGKVHSWAALSTNTQEKERLSEEARWIEHEYQRYFADHPVG